MKKLTCLLIVFWIVLSAIPSLAQSQIDSAKANNFSDLNLVSDLFSNNGLRNDSVLTYAYFYDILKQNNVFAPVTGNPGSASFLFFDYSNSDKLFTDGFNQFSPYVLSPLKNFPSYYAERRFSNISYHLASKKEQHIFIKHEQRIKPWFIMGLDFGASSAPGDFSRTLNKNRNFDFYLGYEAPSKVYRTYISYTSNFLENEENGGIATDSVFENATSLDTRTLPINLPSASNRYRSRDYFLKQELNLSRLIQRADSIERAGKFKSGSLVLNHSVWWKRKSMLFTSQNADSGYFNNYYIDSTVTYDSSFYNDLYQVAMLEYTTSPTASGLTFKLGGGFEYQIINYQTSFADTTFNTGAAVISAGLNFNNFHAGLFYSKSVTGEFKNGYRTRLYLTYLPGRQNNELYLNLNANKLAHSAKEILYTSNHFLWNNDFELLEQYDVTTGFTFAKYKLNIEARSRMSKNLIFYREDYLPQSYGDFVSVSEIALSNILKFGKFGIDTKFIYTSSSNENVAPVPMLSLFSSLYYHNLFFKNVLGFKAGFDVSYFSSYYGYGYMPATGIFYIQQEKKIGNYPQLGVFVNLKIKSKATLFIRLDHVNAGLSERTYYGAYHYPLPGRTFKFGVWWDLVD